MRLSRAQLAWLRVLATHGLGVERDGTYMPTRSDVRTFKALHDRGLVAFAHTGQNGFIYNGFYITEEGKKVYGRENEKCEEQT